MALITKAEFLAAKNEFAEAPKEVVEIYEGAEVYVSALNAKASFEILLASQQKDVENEDDESQKETSSKETSSKGTTTDVFEMIRLCTYDANGVALFDTVEEVQQLRGDVFAKLTNAVFSINKLLGAEQAIEDAEKNLEEVVS